MSEKYPDDYGSKGEYERQVHVVVLDDRSLVHDLSYRCQQFVETAREQVLLNVDGWQDLDDLLTRTAW